MPMGNVGETVSGMFGDLKSKLGFDRNEQRYDRYDDNYDDNYDEYSDFDEYSAKRDDHYNDDEPIGGYRPLTDSVAYSPNRYSSNDISSSLVSIDDVKISTPLPDLSGYDRSKNDEAYRAPSALGGSLDSVADATTYSASLRAASRGTTLATSAQGASDTTYDPYVAYSSSNPVSHTPARSLTVIKPVVYGDVERVARAVKSGDVVVLDMHLTQDELSKRILDFSFGVASALDANVECPGEKVFAIAKGSSLTEDEKRRLSVQGVL